MEKKRLKYLDLAKGIGIILVVTGHSTYADTSLLRWLSSFHMPLFFIITGMLLAFTGEEYKPFGVTVKTKAVRLLIPYGFFSVFYIISNIQLLYKNKIPINLSSISDYLYQTFTLYGISVLWFLTALFLGELLFLFVLKKWKITGVYLMTIVAVFITGFLCPMFQKMFSGSTVPWKIIIYYLGIVIFRMFLAYIFIGAGYGLYKLSVKIKLNRAVNILLAIAFMAANIYLALSAQTVDMHFCVFGNIFHYLITAIFGASSIILFCKGIDFDSEKSLIGYLGKNSLIIMLTHMDFRFLSIAIKFSKSLYSLLGATGIWILYILIAMIMLVLELICIWIINHYFRFLLGAGILKKRSDNYDFNSNNEPGHR